MKEIVVISGKGGTGKTSITASIAYLGGKDVVVADCDVDAADMHLLMKPDYAKSEDFYSGEIAEINPDMCINCGKCKEVCRFNAVSIANQKHTVSSLNCEGCGYCARVCPVGAISMVEQNVGKVHISNTKAGNMMVHAELGIGADNSGKLVAKVKKEAKLLAEKTNKEFIIIDGSPGVGCPVVSSLSGADFVVLVTEPTVAGLHDLERVYQLVKKFNIKAGCIINKADLNTNVEKEIQEFLKRENVAHIANLPYDETFTKAMTVGQTIVEYGESDLKNIVAESWDKVKELVAN
ncbi:ATP-binding protein [Ancylomarina sp. 16SWW S1-10-2]|uniref:ATP-binding protein n=1 Tax=Ancylomarina sp. 16SWW S1-10-2 TaxID=2499681 RepID=UPI0012AE5DCA|nr:ATP-binding protein [Ancylomarina sp. 16SWW S1-10-2]MRT93622.1 4Fe-4S dicluster domain-containing protein [Ancylomarina sp. 16SWW S1-10-2]